MIGTPILTSAASRKMHGAAGIFDLSLSLVADQPDHRAAQGPAQTIVITFDKPINAATRPSPRARRRSAHDDRGNDVVVTFTGVTDRNT